MNNKRKILFALLLSLTVSLFASESLKSIEEEYYDFLFLKGYAERPTLGYRTLSDSTWEVSKNLVWTDLSLSREESIGDSDFTYRYYGLHVFTSYNSAYPYGQNDGDLVQGKGLNSSLSGGVRIEGKGLEITFKPQLSFTQNLAYAIMPAGGNYDSSYAYYWSNIDYPQRFGDDPFFSFDWGDSELRYTWKTFTFGVGTQAMWSGPAYLNPMLHSNNAAGYPKFDFGFRKSSVTLPHVGYIGELEMRVYAGIPSYSDYYKTGYDTSNKKLITGLNASYAPSFLPGLTFSFNKLFMTKFSWSHLREYLPRLFLIPQDNSGDEDGKASFSASWVFPESGFELYGELGIDDYVSGLLGYVRYPFHTMIYTVGLKKTVDLNVEKNIYGEFFFEWNDNEMSQDFQFQYGYTFYSHSSCAGYTNNGQLMGGASAPGGNSQYVGFKVYHPKGQYMFYVHRTNPDNNYLYSKVAQPEETDADAEAKYFFSYKTTLALGATADYALSSQLWIHGGVVYELVLNALYKTDAPSDQKFDKDMVLNNFRGEFGITYSW